LEKKGLEGPYAEALERLTGVLTETHQCPGQAELVRFCALTPLSQLNHKQLYGDVMRALRQQEEMRKDLVGFEEALDPTAVLYNKKPSPQFPELLDPSFPSTEYDEINFMRHFVAFAVTRLQLVREQCTAGSVEKDLVSHCLRAWCVRAMDYM
jgi:hypothetical protein